MVANPTLAQNQAEPASKTLMTNARIFVLVEGNKIATIAESITPPVGATAIDAKGRTMTPGFIDAHVHISMQVDDREVSTIDEYYFAFVQGDKARKMLMRGFTTARDVGGNTFSLKRTIDEGRFPGHGSIPLAP